MQYFVVAIKLKLFKIRDGCYTISALIVLRRSKLFYRCPDLPKAMYYIIYCNIKYKLL